MNRRVCKVKVGILHVEYGRGGRIAWLRRFVIRYHRRNRQSNKRKSLQVLVLYCRIPKGQGT
jgi:hypothetical protein